MVWGGERQWRLKYVSMFSGIEAASAAWKPLGWEAQCFSEIEPFPVEVLKHHYPDVTCHGDMLEVDWSQYAGSDVVVGGPPCQAFSVAGVRGSLDDDRGNLTLEFIRACDTIDPRYIVFENVPGILSTKDNAFGCLLGGLVGSDTPLDLPQKQKRWADSGMVVGPQRICAWRILDAQYFKLAQRRRRVFLVAVRASDGINPAAILFEPKSLQGNSPPSREEGQEAPADIEKGVNECGNGGGRQPCVTESRLSPTLTSSGPPHSRTGGRGAEVDAMVSSTINESGSYDRGDGADNLVAQDRDRSIASTVDARYGKNQGTDDQHVDANCPNYVLENREVAKPLGSHPLPRQDLDNDAYVTHPLTRRHDSSEDGGGRGTPLVAAHKSGDENRVASAILKTEHKGPGHNRDDNIVVFDPRNITHPENRSNPKPGDPCPTLNTGSPPAFVQEVADTVTAHEGRTYDQLNAGGSTHNLSAEPTYIQDVADPLTRHEGRTYTHEGTNFRTRNVTALDLRNATRVKSEAWGDGIGDDKSFTHTTGVVHGVSYEVSPELAVRRLTTTECERLQGFPDGYTQIAWRKKAPEDCPDGPRYAALGNSMAVPVLQWIGERIELVEEAHEPASSD